MKYDPKCLIKKIYKMMAAKIVSSGKLEKKLDGTEEGLNIEDMRVAEDYRRELTKDIF